VLFRSHRATKAFFEEDYRLAVVNAATAVELAITQAIERRLAPQALRQPTLS